MARPPKQTAKLDHGISFRLTKADYQSFQEKVQASGLSPSAFFRNYVLANKTIIPPGTVGQISKDLLYRVNIAIKKLMSLAMYLRATGGKSSMDEATYLRIVTNLVAIQDLLKEGLSYADTN